MNIKQIVNFVEKYSSSLILGLGLAVVLLLVLNLIAQLRIASIRKKYDRLVDGVEGINLEGALINLNDSVGNMKEKILRLEGDLGELTRKQALSLQKQGLIRYNALEDLGSNQSYSVALLDEHNTGFIITSLYGRDFTASYLKPIKEAESEYKLSKEEAEALDQAIKS